MKNNQKWLFFCCAISLCAFRVLNKNYPPCGKQLSKGYYLTLLFPDIWIMIKEQVR